MVITSPSEVVWSTTRKRSRGLVEETSHATKSDDGLERFGKKLQCGELGGLWPENELSTHEIAISFQGRNVDLADIDILVLLLHLSILPKSERPVGLVIDPLVKIL